VHCQPGRRPEVDDAQDAAVERTDPLAERRDALAQRRSARRQAARAWLDRLQGWLLPPRCVLCLDPGQPPALDLCAACASDLPALGSACIRCGVAWPGSEDAPSPCPRCAAAPPPYAAVLAPYAYAWPVDALVRSFKYHGQLPHGRVLGTLLAEAVQARGAPLPELLVPVPLHPQRERERGYNQAWELARVVGRLLDVPVAATLCVRTRATPPQASLDAAARRANLAAAFAVRRPPAARHVALVDDVLTTGATLAALASALLAAGVRRVDAWTVARA
jgi:ComF family protein